MNHLLVTGLICACLLLLALAAIEHYTRRSVIPTVCWILLAGTFYGAWATYAQPGLPVPEIDPEIVLYLFLPLLIFESARKLAIRQLLSVAPEVGLLSTVGVIAGAILIALPFAWFGKVPFIDALLFGSIISATDPVAVAAIFGQFKFPEKLRTLVEGESLINDATTVILFTVLGGLVLEGAVFSVRQTALGFLGALGGAVILGVTTGFLCARIIRWWNARHDRFISALLPLATVYLTFAIAEHYFHFSGVIAVMAVALTLTGSDAAHKGDHANESDAAPPSFIDEFLEFLGRLANAVLFFVLGAAIGAHLYFFPWQWIPLLVISLIVARGIVVYGGLGVLRLAGRTHPIAWQHVQNMAGLKGALSVALLLLLPATYEYRHALLCAAFVMIFFTMIANPLLMLRYLKHVELETEAPESSGS